MGFDCALREIFSFTYHMKLDNDLAEHEYDHVFLGTFDGEPTPNPRDVDAWKWIDLEELQRNVGEHPERYTYWFRMCIDQVIRHHDHELLVAERQRP